MAQAVKNLPAVGETLVGPLDWEDPLKEMASLSSILFWRIQWAEKSRRLQSMGSLRVGHDRMTENTHRIQPVRFWKRELGTGTLFFGVILLHLELIIHLWLLMPRWSWVGTSF